MNEKTFEEKCRKFIADSFAQELPERAVNDLTTSMVSGAVLMLKEFNRILQLPREERADAFKILSKELDDFVGLNAYDYDHIIDGLN